MTQLALVTFEGSAQCAQFCFMKYVQHLGSRWATSLSDNHMPSCLFCFPRSLQLCSIICWKDSEEQIMCHGDSFCSNKISSSIESTWVPGGGCGIGEAAFCGAFLSSGQNSISDVGSYSLQTWHLTLKLNHILRYQKLKTRHRVPFQIKMQLEEIFFKNKI